MIKTTTWRHDTCDCEIEYEWDDTLSADDRMHRAKKINKACAEHANLDIDKYEHFNAVLRENRGKNRMLAAILEEFPQITEEKTNDDGSKYKELKKDHKYEWSFDQ